MIRRFLTAALLWLPIAAFAQCAADYRALYAQNTPAEEALFSLPGAYAVVPHRQWQNDATLRCRIRGWRMSGGGYTDTAESQGQAVLYELYDDFPAAGLDWTVGKKVLAWGVGYGFRPLDVIQREQRLADRPRDLEGVPLLAGEYFTARSTWTLVWANRLAVNDGTITPAANEVALRYYASRRGVDVYLIGHQVAGGATSAGVGFATVWGTQLEWHASARYLSQYAALQRDPDAPRLSQTDPLREVTETNAVQWLAGGRWSWANGVSALIEAWYDGTGYTLSQWRGLRDVAQRQRGLLETGAPAAAVYNNLRWESRIYARSTLRGQVLIRLDFTGERVFPSADLLWTPADGGLVYRVVADYEVNRYLRVFATWRGMGGRAGSVYAEGPVRWTVLAGLRVGVVFD